MLENNDSDSDCDYDADIESYAKTLHRAFDRAKKAWDRRPKGRQGRSRASRKRAEEARRQLRWFKYEDPVCKCGARHFSEDCTSGDVVCRECGVVASSKGLGFTELLPPTTNSKSKPYQRVVHFRQRYAQLVGTDPRIEDSLFEKIHAKIEEMKIPLETFGKKSFSLVLRAFDDPNVKRLSANWIQVRRRLGLYEIPPEVDQPEFLKMRLCRRYQCIDVVFQSRLWSQQGERGRPECLERKNIVNVNYVALQLIRLESEQLFRAWAPYFPQLTSKKQPGLNNRRWAILMLECQKSFARWSCPKTGEVVHFRWDYEELTKKEIEKWCSGFE